MVTQFNNNLSYFGDSHDKIRSIVQQFVQEEIMPFIEEWEEKGEFPRELYKKAAQTEILGVGFPEEYGGYPGDIFLQIALSEELMQAGSVGLTVSLTTHGIALPPILRRGNEEQKKRFVTPVLKGEKLAALAISEPDCGSDVANLKTTATKEGEFYIVNGRKAFVTCGYRADHILCAVRTGKAGAHGISLLVIEANTPGYHVLRNLKKMGWWTADLAEIEFENCRVPTSNLIGKENMGFYGIMENFQSERLHLAVIANITSEIAFEEAMLYAKERQAFEKAISEFQVIAHKLVDMATLIEASREFVYRIAAKIDAGIDQTKEISMAKNFACKVSDKVTYDAVQILGGKGFIRGNVVERLYRDNRAFSIGGGTTEVMKEIIAKLIF